MRWFYHGKHEHMLHSQLTLTGKNHRTSATNAAEIYNHAERSHTLMAELDLNATLSLHLSTEQAWDAFFTYSLLVHHQEHGTFLELDHNAPSHAERLRPALQARNLLMVGPGQEEWSHVCYLCCWVHTTADGETGGTSFMTFLSML